MSKVFSHPVLLIAACAVVQSSSVTPSHGPAMRNRFMLAPLTSQQSDHDGSPSRFDQGWIAQVSQGGYGLMQSGAAYVEPGGIAYGRQLGIHSDAHLVGLTKMANAIRAGGALSAVQLHHAGHRAAPEMSGISAPASGLTLAGISALTTEEVERIRDSFIAAARRAELAGFDGVALHAPLVGCFRSSCRPCSTIEPIDMVNPSRTGHI